MHNERQPHETSPIRMANPLPALNLGLATFDDDFSVQTGLIFRITVSPLLKNAPTFRLGDCRQDRDVHFGHRAFGADTVIQKPHGDAHVIDLFNELDHIGRIAVKAIQLLHKNDIAFLYFNLQ